MDLKNTLLLTAFAVAIATGSVQAQTYGERPQRYGNTASFFFYDNRDDQRDFPTNGAFPGNFASDPSFAGVGGAGWLGSNPQHQAMPYPSQSYHVDVHGTVACPRTRLVQASDGRRYRRCQAP